VHEVREGTLAVDLDDGQPLSVTSLQLRVAGDVDLLELERLVGTRGLDHPPGRRAEMAASRVVEDDARYG
jgi:hypothetical protein